MIRTAHIFYAVSIFAAVALHGRTLRQALPAGSPAAQTVSTPLVCPAPPPSPAAEPLGPILPAAWDLAPQRKTVTPAAGGETDRSHWEITRAERRWRIKDRHGGREYVWFGTVLRDGALAAVFRTVNRSGEPRWLFLRPGRFLDDLEVIGLAVDQVELRGRDGRLFEMGMFAAAPVERHGK